MNINRRIGSLAVLLFAMTLSPYRFGGSWRSSMRRLMPVLALLLGLSASSTLVQAQAASYSGNITWLEVWKIGNVAFRLDAPNPPCNGQFVLNKSDPGFKNLYGALIAAQLAGKRVRVYTSSCIPAENYGGNYIEVSYLYYE